jgi:RNA polymerase sigma-70 factor (ECF subfamily)
VSGVAAAQLYERYSDKIYRYCLCRLRNREEAADATQNTFLRVYVALEKGVVPQYEASWLYKIAHNVCLSLIESSGRRALVETPRDLDSLDDAVLAAPASEHEAVEELAEALAALPHNLRQAILLREWQGLSYTEIAAAMDTTVSAVETLLVRARRELKATLERNGARLRGAAAGLFNVPGLRGLLSGGLGKVSAGAALVAVGGSGIAATYAFSGTRSSPPLRPAPSIGRPTPVAFESAATGTATAAPLPRERTAAASRAPHRIASTDARRPGVSSPPPSAPPATATSSGTVPNATVSSSPHDTSVPTLRSLPTTTLPQTVTAPALPVTAPTVTVPAVIVPAITVSAVTTPAVTVTVP